MSDARPITDVTEFVCGKCWSSFSNSDAGVDAGAGKIRCPHCGHVQPSARNVTDAVRAAPASGLDTMSSSFEPVDDADAPPAAAPADATEQVARAPAAAQAELVDATTASVDVRSIAQTTKTAAVAEGAVAAPAAVSAPAAVAGPSAQPRTASSDDGRQTAAYAAEAASTAADSARTSDVAAAAEDFMDAFAPTLDAVGTVSAPAVAVQGSPQLSASVTVGDEFDITAMNELTDPDVDVDAVAAQLAAADDFSLSDTGDFGDGPLSLTDTGDFGADPFGDDDELPVSVNADTGEHVVPALDEPQEWKLKAPPGLTYNFHSLDALMGWASNKDPEVMEISTDGSQWRPFAPFLAAARDGLSGRQSWDVAGGVKILPQRGGHRSAMDDIAQVDAIATAQAQLQIAPDLDFGDPAAPEEGDPLSGALSDTLDEDDHIADALSSALAGRDDGPDPFASAELGSASASSSSAVRRASSTDLAAASSAPATQGTHRASSSAVPAARGSSSAVPAASDLGGSRRASGERPRPEKVALKKKEGPPVLAIAAAVLVVGGVVAALVVTGVL